MIARRPRLRILILATILQTGCGTIATKSNGAWGKPYSGAACSAAVTDCTARTNGGTKVVVPFSALDTVLSAVVDTILLPVDLIVPNKSNACGGCDILMVLPYGLTEHCQGAYHDTARKTSGANPGQHSDQLDGSRK
jgi:uncharacterized protein YceK